jgi:AcrR family transcriptional regulator
MINPLLAWTRSEHDHPLKKRLRTVLRLFEDRGFEGALMRDIVEPAGANVSAIRHYFGNKAGLYRATLTEPFCEVPSLLGSAADLTLSLHEALRREHAQATGVVA